MPDVVVSIIVKDTEKAIRETKKLETRFDQLAKKAKQAGQALKAVGVGVGVAVGIFYAAIQAADQLADRLDTLGQKKAAENLRSISVELNNLVDVLLTTETGFGKVGEVVGKLATLAIIPIKGYAAAVAIAGGATQVLAQTLMYLGGVIDRIKGKTTEFTEEWLRFSTLKTVTEAWGRATTIVFGKTEDAINKVGSALDRTNAKLHNRRKTLDDVIRSQKKSNDELNKSRQIENAIRTGDARALADLQASGGAGSAADAATTAGGGMRANRPGFLSTSRNRGDASTFAGGGGKPANESNMSSRASDSSVNVEVYIGNKPLKDSVEEVVVNGVVRAKGQSKTQKPRR